jgi:hypothetical protein
MTMEAKSKSFPGLFSNKFADRPHQRRRVAAGKSSGVLCYGGCWKKVLIEMNFLQCFQTHDVDEKKKKKTSSHNAFAQKIKI